MLPRYFGRTDKRNRYVQSGYRDIIASSREAKERCSRVHDTDNNAFFERRRRRKTETIPVESRKATILKYNGSKNTGNVKTLWIERLLETRLRCESISPCATGLRVLVAGFVERLLLNRVRSSSKQIIIWSYGILRRDTNYFSWVIRSD